MDSIIIFKLEANNEVFNAYINYQTQIQKVIYKMILEGATETEAKEFVFERLKTAKQLWKSNISYKN